MFNRNNLPSVPNPFSTSGSPGGAGARPPRDRYNTPPQQSGRPDAYGQDPRMAGGYGSPLSRRDYDTVMTDGYSEPQRYGGPPAGRAPVLPSRTGGGRMTPAGGASDQVWTLRPAKSPDNSYTYGNL